MAKSSSLKIRTDCYAVISYAGMEVSMPCLNQNIVSAVTFSAANSFRRNSLRSCVHLASWSNRYAPQTLKHVRRTMYRS